MKYVIGIDFGTLSARAVLARCDGGEIVADSTFCYPHGVMDTSLPSGKSLPNDFALQHPADYLLALSKTVSGVLSASGVDAGDVVGIGVDFTSCTILPIDKNGTPLCMLREYEDEPHAYVKLWKHHGAAPDAERINQLAREMGEPWLLRYGGKMSCEFMLPKVCEILRCAPEVYSAAHRFIEAGDWISLMLTGKETRSPAFAGYKSCYIEGIGYPRKSFMQALDGRLCDLFGKKIPNKVSPITSTAGTLSAKGAALCGLTKGCAVSLPMIDAHAPMVALNLVGAGDMIATLGTSGCYIIHSKTETCIPGIGGYVRDGVIPDMITYEAGQAAVGDMFAWFVDRYMPFEYMNAAARRGISIHKLLREKAESLRPGQSGLLCLDWLNGNRSVLSDPSLSGMILGIDLQTKPEEIYRALIEASAYGARIILEAFAGGGVECRRIVAAGGIAQKDEMMMQIYADVFNMEINVTRVGQGGALGAAIYAAYAAGEYDSVEKASAAMACRDYITYTPIPENAAIYQQLYLEYKKLHDFFGKQNFTMHKLKELKNL